MGKLMCLKQKITEKCIMKILSVSQSHNLRSRREHRAVYYVSPLASKLSHFFKGSLFKSTSLVRWEATRGFEHGKLLVVATAWKRSKSRGGWNREMVPWYREEDSGCHQFHHPFYWSSNLDYLYDHVFFNDLNGSNTHQFFHRPKVHSLSKYLVTSQSDLRKTERSFWAELIVLQSHLV